MSDEAKPNKTADIRAYHREWSRKNKDRIKARMEARKEIIKEQRKASRAANAEKIKAYHAEWRKKHPKRAAEFSRRYRLKVSYGMSELRYRRLVACQGGMCLICDAPSDEGANKLRVDHSHETGELRGLLCARCNSGLGFFRDDPNLLRRASAYLRNPPTSVGYRRSGCPQPPQENC